jgi:adenosylcobinamide-GDP ribazoletransferase
MAPDAQIRKFGRSLVKDLTIALLFYTCLPLAPPTASKGADVVRASWAAPLVGAIIGAVGALVYWLAYAMGLASLPAAALALAATLGISGALHEDGLADTADGLGGGATRDTRLEIMADSRIGTYGACAVMMSIFLRATASASLADPALVATAMIAANAAARGTIPAFMRLVPPAKGHGLSADAGTPPAVSTMTATIAGMAALFLGLGPRAGSIALLLVLATAGAIAWLSIKAIGGQTGDVIGAVEQTTEISILLVAAAQG